MFALPVLATVLVPAVVLLIKGKGKGKKKEAKEGSPQKIELSRDAVRVRQRESQSFGVCMACMMLTSYAALRMAHRNCYRSNCHRRNCYRRNCHRRRTVSQVVRKRKRCERRRPEEGVRRRSQYQSVSRQMS